MPVNGMHLEDVSAVQAKIDGVKIAAGRDVENFHPAVFPINDRAVGVRVHTVRIAEYLEDFVGLFVGKDEVDPAVNAHAGYVIGIAHHPAATPIKYTPVPAAKRNMMGLSLAIFNGCVNP